MHAPSMNVVPFLLTCSNVLQFYLSALHCADVLRQFLHVTYTSLPAATSKIHKSCPSGRTNPAGNGGDEGEKDSVGTDCLTTGALEPPAATTATQRAAFRTGRVRVMRLGGGLGESVIEATHAVDSNRSGWEGKREATWPSGPMPRRMRSKEGYGEPAWSEQQTTRRKSA